MAGRRHEMDSIGESYEVFAESVLSRIAALTRIGTKSDFGTDIYCQPRVKTGARTESVTELCVLQVKGGQSPLEYGGLDNGQWKQHEFHWLKSLWAPEYLATVDTAYQTVDLFSLWPIWWVFWQCDTPFKIVCSGEEPADSLYEFSHPTKLRSIDGSAYGDGHIWTVHLGPPILRLTHQSLNDKGLRDQALKILRHWIAVDRQTVARFHVGVPLIDANYQWQTNQMPSARQELLAMDNRPGMGIERLARTLVPPLLALGAHMQHQGNRDAFCLIPVLQWIQAKNFGNLITPQLLENLSRAQREGVSPATYL